jgi:hypothetical protein
MRDRSRFADVDIPFRCTSFLALRANARDRQHREHSPGTFLDVRSLSSVLSGPDLFHNEPKAAPAFSLYPDFPGCRPGLGTDLA